jgi:hypothetical protein
MLFDCIEEGEVQPHRFPSSSSISDPPAKRSRKGVPKKGTKRAAPSHDEEEVEEMERLFVNPPIRTAVDAPAAQKSRRGAQPPAAVQEEEEEEEEETPVKKPATKRATAGIRGPSPVIPVTKTSATAAGDDDEEEEEVPVKVPATKRSTASASGGGRGAPSPIISDKGDLTPVRGRKASSNGNAARKRALSPDVDDEEASPTPVKVPVTKRSRSSPSPSSSPSPVRLRLPLQDSDDEWNEDRGPSAAAAEEASPSW